MELLACLFLVTTLVGGGLAVGFLSSSRLNSARQQRLDRQAAQVRADMEALRRKEQLNTAFLAARQAMWDEARRHRTSGYR